MRRLASASAIIFIFVMRPAHSRPLESFTVSDEIALAHFNQWGSVAPPVVVSPDASLRCGPSAVSSTRTASRTKCAFTIWLR